ncbi:mitochondrial distribution/morphology family 35/apoptosis [Lentinula guzmanii]|uniref:Mitochondrial distribution/morphology family 35/apoptosis n=3 Tax=Lentinula TaxID=5352 RepID=A0AA38MV07_9AGAR|nr:mitochondrial distribution/morphology family 35/apoptosis [Lentinula guzmanii]KAJ3749388.1 mitochondrial distribution/morphology family 35/apoptosis [Lentinula detonsa]KAJ3789636.1 mitochondrial distribution/morphology family 35/apoptosis [Lentinula aff. detonsa]KAJ3800300.1 mitochondrial distribution/morphology family 35/apoptosis [Lentinula aff. detonsa]KAJ3986717.1 mitochondrial distribution/morphology family 35/apoptosis [Lentinula detonsa]
MAESLLSECTPLKKEYDSCFNAWFEGYLEPAVSASSSPEKYSEYSQRKAEEFQQKCGKIWEGYRACVQKALKEKGLDTMLQQSREENPLSRPPPLPPSGSSSS